MASSSSSSADPPLRVAVVGAGIVGLALAVGLLDHGVDVTLYEQARVQHHIGAGIGLVPTAVAALEALSPAAAAEMRRIALRSEYRQILVDGASPDDLAKKPPCSMRGAQDDALTLYTMARAAFAEALLARVPTERLHLGKKLVDVMNKSESGPTTMVFDDGTTAETDAVVGCDGVKSRVRRALLGDAHPAAHCQYAEEVCYRALVDTAALRQLLGPLASSVSVYVGSGAYLIIYPIGSLANISVYVATATPLLPGQTSHKRIAPRAELVAALANMGPSIRGIADLLPSEVHVWALHDLHEHPLDTYAFGRTCLAGDAAHAATSHQGAGAGFGIEDAAVLCKLLQRVQARVTDGGSSAGKKADMVAAAMEVYDGARRVRSQWLVGSSRQQGRVMKGLDPVIGRDMDKIRADCLARAKTLGDCDVRKTIEEALGTLGERIAVLEATS